MEEPSKKWPDSNFSGPNVLVGTLTCCSLPRVSVKRRSTNLTSLSLIVWNMSFGVIVFSLPFQTRGLFLLSPWQKVFTGKRATFCHKQKKPSTSKIGSKTSLVIARHLVVPEPSFFITRNFFDVH